jgi:hypothetical protein
MPLGYVGNKHKRGLVPFLTNEQTSDRTEERTNVHMTESTGVILGHPDAIVFVGGLPVEGATGLPARR